MNDLFTNSGPGAAATTPRPESNGKPDTGKANTKTTVSEVEYPHAGMSLFASGFSKEPVERIDLAELVRDIRDGKWRNQVDQLRAMLEAGDKAGYNEGKRTLPAVSLSGEITGPRKAAPDEGRFKHSGFLQGDFDAKDHPGMSLDEMLKTLRDDPHVECVFRSPSNLGAKAVIRIEPDLAKHRDSFRAAKVHFANLGLVIDESTKDPNRLCFVSFDPEATLRKWGDDAEILPPALPEVKPEPRPQKTPPVHFAPREEDKEATIRALLAFIPARPDYPDWILVCSAVWNEIAEAGTPLLLGWSPEESPGEYDRKFSDRLTEPGMGALVNIAKRHGYAPEHRHRAESSGGGESCPTGDIPANVFPVPAGGISFTECAGIIFPAMAEKKRLFMRDRVIHEIVTSRGEADFLAPVTPERFASVVETFGRRVARREIDKATMKAIWRSTTFPVSYAKVIINSDVAGDSLPRISQLVNCPVLTKEGAMLSRGWHEHCGGTYIGKGSDPPDVPLKPAIEALESLLADFAFTTPSDRARALASLLSPAMKAGGWIDDDFPLDVAEADQSQSGKTYRQTLVARLYGERAVSIAPAKGGVGSLDESISAAMVKGRPFVTLANFRGRLDSTILEEATRGSGRVTCRTLRASAEIETRPFNWQLSTNGAEFTRDIANRSIITRIRKQPEGYAFRTFPEGDLLAHVEANQGFYLGAVFAVLRVWKAHGCPTTAERRHDFRGWCQALDWIVQNILGAPALLDGHREEQARTANPALQWLRDVALAAKGANQIGRQLSTSDLCSVAEDAGIEFPGNPASREEPAQRAGKILGRLFRETEGRAVSVDRFEVNREQISTLNHAIGEYREKPFYTISESL